MKKKPSAQRARPDLKRVRIYADDDDSSLRACIRLNMPELLEATREQAITDAMIRALSHDATVTSKRAAAELMGIDKRALVKYAAVSAELILQLDRDLRFRIEQSIAMSQVEKLQYLDVEMSDETPMPVGRRDALFPPSNAASLAAAAADTDLAMWTQESSHQSLNLVSQPIQILQSRSAYSMLLKSPDGEYTMFGGATLNALAHVERTTAECRYQAHLDRTGITASSDVFPNRVRVSSLDAASSNPRCEACIVDNREGWTALNFRCEDHIVFNICGGLGKMHDADASGQIHWALF